jgi:RNA polymerase sigma-70 factor, ECF subfamily
VSDSKAWSPGPDGQVGERELIHRVVLRDDAALETLYTQLSGSVYAAALTLLRQRSEAEEVVQETFVHLWTRARDFDPSRGSLVAWLVMLARSRSIDRLRAQAHKARLAASQEDALAFAESPATPLELTQRAATRHHVSAALATLPPDQRRTIELAFHEGLSHSEISARTGEPLGTVKTRIRRGLERIARQLTTEGVD